MNFDKSKKNKLRKEILELISDLPNGEMVHLDKNILEDILFVNIKDKRNTYKIITPILTPEILRKIDLSEISFENVLFNYTCQSEEILKKIYGINYLDILYGNKFLIDLSYTNANIDFSKIFGRSCYKCNFSHVDLSNSKLKFLQVVSESDFSYTNIEEVPNKAFLSGVNFKGNRFEGQKIPVSRFNINCDNGISGCNFNGTGLKIVSSQSKIANHEVKEELRRSINRGLLDNCFLNGKLIFQSHDIERKSFKKK